MERAALDFVGSRRVAGPTRSLRPSPPPLARHPVIYFLLPPPPPSFSTTTPLLSSPLLSSQSPDSVLSLAWSSQHPAALWKHPRLLSRASQSSRAQAHAATARPSTSHGARPLALPSGNTSARLYPPFLGGQDLEIRWISAARRRNPARVDRREVLCQ